MDSLTEDELDKLKDIVERITDPESGEVKLKCKLCHRREFRLIGAMEKHFEDHKAGKVTPTVECGVCKKTFSSEARLLRHNIIHQATATKPKNFRCRQCDKTFKWKSCLQAHKKKCTPASISKGATKSKATLKAKEKLQQLVEDMSSEEETQSDGDLVEVYDISQEVIYLIDNRILARGFYTHEQGHVVP